jgi:hypothetical protein
MRPEDAALHITVGYLLFLAGREWQQNVARDSFWLELSTVNFLFLSRSLQRSGLSRGKRFCAPL